MQYRVPATIALAVLLLTSGCVGALASDTTVQAEQRDQSPPAQQGVPATGSNISVSASGQASAAPDQAVVRVGIERYADDASTARQRLADNASQLRDALADIGVNASQITTSGYDIREPHRGPENYVARQRFTVTVSDPDRAGEVIDAAVGNGANRVDGVQFTVSDDRREQLQQRALEDAMDRARQRADTMAESADLSITGVRSVSTAERFHRPVYLEMSADASGGASTSIDSGPVSVSVQVEVVYAAEQSG